MSTRALVTGGGGFIGSHLVEAMLQRGHRVRVLDNFASGRRENLSRLEGEVELVEGDIQSFERVDKAVAGCEIVLHEAALPSVQRSIQDPLTTNATNVIGTLNVLLAARNHEVRRVVCASSSSVYGSASSTAGNREEDPAVPISPYAVAKLASESYARSFYGVFDLDTVSLRYFNVFGPRQDPNSHYSAVIPRFVSAVIAGLAAVIFGDGEQSRDFTYVQNVVHANLLAMDAAGVAGRVYNIACGQRVTLNRLIRELGELIGLEVEPAYAAPRAGDIRHSLADISLARQELGYEPVMLLRDGLRCTLEHARLEQPTGEASDRVLAGEP